MAPTKKRFIVSGFIISSLTLLASWTQAGSLKFGLKLTGGMNYLSGGDINTHLEGQTNYWKEFSDVHGYSLEGRLKKIQLGADFEGDVIISFSSRFAISAGSGYISGQKKANKMAVNSPARKINWASDDRISAIPLTLGLCSSIPVSSRLRLYLSAGAGYYLAKWSQSGELNDQSAFVCGESWNIKTKGNGVGFQGGIGFEYDLADNLIIVFDGFGRYAKIGGFKGDLEWRELAGTSSSGSGTVYYYEWKYSSTGSWFPDLSVEKDLPGGTNVRKAREAKIDFSGFSIRAGIKIYFKALRIKAEGNDSRPR